MSLYYVIFFQLLYFLCSLSRNRQAVSMNATAILIVVIGHVVYLTNVALSVVFLNGRSWWWQLNENCIDFALIFSEGLTSVTLKSWVLEVCTHFNDVCNSQCGKVMLSPFVPPFKILQSFTDLPFAVNLGFDISD